MFICYRKRFVGWYWYIYIYISLEHSGFKSFNKEGKQRATKLAGSCATFDTTCYRHKTCGTCLWTQTFGIILHHFFLLTEILGCRSHAAIVHCPRGLLWDQCFPPSPRRRSSRSSSSGTLHIWTPWDAATDHAGCPTKPMCACPSTLLGNVAGGPPSWGSQWRWRPRCRWGSLTSGAYCWRYWGWPCDGVGRGRRAALTSRWRAISCHPALIEHFKSSWARRLARLQRCSPWWALMLIRASTAHGKPHRRSYGTWSQWTSTGPSVKSSSRTRTPAHQVRPRPAGTEIGQIGLGSFSPLAAVFGLCCSDLRTETFFQ